MDTTIYYFTGTGNSLKVARGLSNRIGNCELVPIAKIWQQKNIVAKTEKVGFVYPLYFWGLPKIVEEFVKKIDLRDVDYIFSVLTRGFTSGRATYDLESILKEKGKILSAGFKVTMPDNYTPKLSIPSKAKQDKKFKRAEIKVEKIAEIVRTNQKKIKKDHFITIKLSKGAHNRWLERASSIDKHFSVDDRCNSCGTCEKVCPVENVRLVNGKPQWHHQCQECLACLHFCPQIAIQVNKKTEKQGRYRHPDLSVEDMIMQKGKTTYSVLDKRNR